MAATQFSGRQRVIIPRCLREMLWPGRCYSTMCRVCESILCLVRLSPTFMLFLQQDTQIITCTNRHGSHTPLCTLMAGNGRMGRSHSRVRSHALTLQSCHSLATEVCKEHRNVQVSAHLETKNTDVCSSIHGEQTGRFPASWAAVSCSYQGRNSWTKGTELSNAGQV